MPGKKTESWVLLSVRVSPEAVEATSAFLLDACPAGIELVDSSHPAPPPDLGPDRVEIRAHFPPGTKPEEPQRALLSFLGRAGYGPGGYAFDPPWTACVQSEDWADGWKKYFKPVRVGRFFIHPGWIRPERDEPFPVRIDPSLAFGTGLHPTTQMCLGEMDRLMPAESFLDVGTGSGILALAAARRGVPRVVALDNDVDACRVAGENFEKNGLQGKIVLIAGEIARVRGRFDLAAANILSGTLIPMAASLTGRLSSGGMLLLSGILAEEADEVIAAYRAAGCRLAGTREEGEWSLVRLAAPGREED